MAWTLIERAPMYGLGINLEGKANIDGKIRCQLMKGCGERHSLDPATPQATYVAIERCCLGELVTTVERHRLREIFQRCARHIDPKHVGIGLEVGTHDRHLDILLGIVPFVFWVAINFVHVREIDIAPRPADRKDNPGLFGVVVVMRRC